MSNIFKHFFNDVWNLASVPALQTLLNENPKPTIAKLLRTEGINREIEIASEELYNLILTEEYMKKLLEHIEERNPIPGMNNIKNNTTIQQKEKEVVKKTETTTVSKGECNKKEEECKKETTQEEDEVKEDPKENGEDNEQDEMKKIKEEEAGEEDKTVKDETNLEQENQKEEDQKNEQEKKKEEEIDAPITERELLVHGVTIINMLAKDMDAIFEFSYLFKPYVEEIFSETVTEKALNEGSLTTLSRYLLLKLYQRMLNVRPNVMIPLLWDIDYFTFDIMDQHFSIEEGSGEILLITKSLSLTNQVKHYFFLKKIGITEYLLNEIENRPSKTYPLLLKMLEAGSENIFPIIREQNMLSKIIELIKTKIPLTAFGPFEEYLHIIEKLFHVEHLKSNQYTRLSNALEEMKKQQDVDAESNALAPPVRQATTVREIEEDDHHVNDEGIVTIHEPIPSDSSDEEESEEEESDDEESEEHVVKVADVPKAPPPVEPHDNLKLLLDGLLDFYIDVLQHPENLELGRMKTTFGVLRPPLGSIRLSIVSFIHELFKLKNSMVDEYLCNHPTLIEYLTDLFFLYEFNNMYHEHYLGIFHIICLEKHNELMETLFSKGRLITRLLAAVSSNNAHEKTRKGARRGYMGHLMTIFKKLEVDDILHGTSIDQSRYDVYGYEEFIKTDFRHYLHQNEIAYVNVQSPEHNTMIISTEDDHNDEEETLKKFETIESGDEIVVCVKSDEDDHPDTPEREPEEVEEFIAFDEHNNQLVASSRPTFIPDSADIPQKSTEFSSSNWWTFSDIDAFSDAKELV